MNWHTTSSTTMGAKLVGASALKLHKVLSGNMNAGDVAVVFVDVLRMINEQLRAVTTGRDPRDKAFGVGACVHAMPVLIVFLYRCLRSLFVITRTVTAILAQQRYFYWPCP